MFWLNGRQLMHTQLQCMQLSCLALTASWHVFPAALRRCNKVDNTHPDTLAQTFYLRLVTVGWLVLCLQHKGFGPFVVLPLLID